MFGNAFRDVLLLRLQNLAHRFGFGLSPVEEFLAGVRRVFLAAGLQMRQQLLNVLGSRCLQLFENLIVDLLSGSCDQGFVE